MNAWSKVTGWAGDPPPVELRALAAATCALADEVVPEHDCEDVDTEEWLGQSASNQACFRCRFKMLSIAAELKGDNTNTETTNEPH